MIRASVLAAVFATFLLACTGASAQMRAIPAEAKRAEIRHLQDNIVELNGKRARLSPGAQVRDAENRIIVPTAIPPYAVAKYLLDEQGEVRRLWLLSPAEGGQRDRNWN